MAVLSVARRFRHFFIAAGVLAACASSAPPHGAGSIAAQRLPLAPDIAAGERMGELVFRGALHLTAEDPRFGGLSGLHVDAGGHVTAISDKGLFVEFDLVEDAAGELVGARHLRIEEMRGVGGATLPDAADRDSEELVVLPDGTRVVAYERDVRLGFFPPGSATAERFVPLRGFVPDGNRGIEAMALLPDGRLLLIAERQGQPNGIRHAWLGTPGRRWERLAYVPDDNDDVAGAALLPDGDLLVIERNATLLFGFRSRLKRVPSSAIAPGARLEGRSLLHLAAPLLSDNFEAVAVRRAGGRVSIYLVSDDNYFALQRALLLKFDLAEPEAETAARLRR